MKLIIIGDSYGVGEYQILHHKMEPIANTGLDFYLKNIGHTVDNLSAGSASNFGQIRNLKTHLTEKNSNYDYVIWFHTEPIRDIVETIKDDPVDGPKQYPNFFDFDDFDQACEYVNEQNYSFVQRIFDTFTIPFITIGGVGRIDACIEKFNFSKLVITSWIEDALNIKNLPRNFLGWHRWEEALNIKNFDKQTLFAHISATQKYQQLLKESTLFPDDNHMVRTEYQKLSLKIDEFLQNAQTR
jgi:hypothetical protein